MEDTVKGNQLKRIIGSLARFADVRETAREPRDRVVIQANGELLKVVAGAPWGTVIATVHATDQNFRAIVSAREFLKSLGQVKAKNEYRVVDRNMGWEVGCSLVEADGTRVADFLRVSKSLPVLLLPPPLESNVQGEIEFTAEELHDLGGVMANMSRPMYVGRDWNEAPVNVAGRIYTENDYVRFSATNDIRFAAREFKGNYEVFGLVFAEFLDSARELGDSTMKLWDENRVTIENETFRAIGRYDMLTKYGPLSMKEYKQALEGIAYKAVVTRSQFVKDLRAKAKLDKDGRIGLQLDDGVLKVLPFDNAKYGWYAKSDNLIKAVSGVASKQIGIGLRKGRSQPINVKVPEWTIEVAPVDLSMTK